MELKRKTHVQLQALDCFYFENNYPSQADMKNYAATLGLTNKQIKSWFAEKRRKDKKENTMVVPLHSKSVEKITTHVRRDALKVDSRTPVVQSLSSKLKKRSVDKDTRVTRTKRPYYLQDLFAPEYILKTVFRKDGPPLGVEFDSLPSTAQFRCKDPGNSYPACKENQRANKRRKVSKQNIVSALCKDKAAPAKKHGMGKGLMTVWLAANPHAGRFPTSTAFPNMKKSVPPNPKAQVRKPIKQTILAERLQKKLQEKKKHAVKRREAECLKHGNQKLPDNGKCELALVGQESQESFHQISMLMDDEELEARESEAVQNPPGCSGHLTSSSRQGCSLCKDQLIKFPPNSVMMKQPFCTQPWESSPESVKKLFKAFHFIYTYSLEIEVCPFTLDEFARAFHDKDSFLLGKINVALLKLLLSDIEVELDNASTPHLSRSCNYHALLHSVENQEISLDIWRRSVNPLTWIEILCQVLVAAGFGAKHSTIRRETLNKEMHLMVKYGLQPGTLKGELFKILLEQGNNGLKVSDLAKSLPIVDLKLASTTDERESLICSMLSSDISLFEKISSATYRLRINTIIKKVEELQSDSEDCGAVDDDPSESDDCSSDQDSGCDARDFRSGRVKSLTLYKNKNNMLNACTEIDESHPGEAWLLGLMEGEYSDLSIEEKLNAMVALIDLLREGSSIRTENPSKAIIECSSNIYHPASGAKIKRSSAKNQTQLVPSWNELGQLQGVKEAFTCWKYHAIDSSASISKFAERSSGRDKGDDTETSVGLHSLQSVFLGSDRRYNRYWLFLGPCNGSDPGHRRIYFESSEDGHWKVIDTEEALRTLLSVLDDRGKREALLLESLEKRQVSLCEAMSNRMNGITHMTQLDQFVPNSLREDSYSPVSDVENALTVSDSLPSSGAIVLEAGNKGEDKRLKWCRLQAYDSWIWNSFYLNLNSVKHGKRSYFESLTRCECCHDLYWRDEKHCRVCHATFEIDFDQEERYAIHAATCRDTEDMFRKVLPSQIQALKAASYSIELVMPEGALVGAWTKSAHKLWVKRLRRTKSLQELLQVLSDFIGAINEDWLFQCDTVSGCYSAEEIIECFPSLPQTTSALALWLVKLDALIAPFLVRATQGNAARCLSHK